MCGIAGLLGRPIDPSACDATLAALRHRGPDGSGRWIERDAALLHARLGIIDLSPAAGQPLTNEDGSVVVTYNGEIYNFVELRAELVARGHTFRTRTDSEVLVHLYEDFGERCVERLEGMFVFGLWDSRRRKLLLARDRCGEKPLYYVVERDWFAFASTARALGALGASTLEPEPAAIPGLLVYGYVPHPRTIFRDIRQLPPATTLSWSPGGAARIERYWSVSFDPVRDDSPGTACSTVRSLLTESVKRRLVADVPVGVFLSGGIDSTIIAALAGRELGSGVRTFCLGFEGDEGFDERAFARLAARELGTEHTEAVVSPDAITHLEALVAHHEAPFGDSSALPTFVLSQLARGSVTVALSGEGGDEVFAGYPRFAAGVLAERIPRSVRSLLRSTFGLPPLSGGGRGLLARLRRFLGAADLTLAQRALRWQSYFAFDLDQLLVPELARAVDPSALLAFHDAPFGGSERTPLGKLLRHNFETYLPCDLLAKLDRMSMAHGLEVRAPFLDTRVVEYAGSLPDRFKLSGWRTKAILRDAFADLVPGSILTRKKLGFGLPLASWFRGPLRDYVRDLLLSPSAALWTWLRPERVTWYVNEHLAGRYDFSWQIWLLLTFETWLQTFSRREALGHSDRVSARCPDGA